MVEIASKNTYNHRVNADITGYDMCLLIDENGDKHPNTYVSDALDMAYDSKLDLVEMTANADMPVCKIMDYGKYLYAQSKKDKANRKKQPSQKYSEVRFGVSIAQGDFNTKIKSISKFLDQGRKVKVSLRFKGREISHPQAGLDLLDRIIDTLQANDIDVNVINKPALEGRNLSMVIVKN